MASEEENLGAIFQEGMDLFNNLGKIDEPTNSNPVQVNIKRSMQAFEKATRLVSLTGLFSTNETIDEIATTDLQYLMLPALLGTLALKLTSGDRKQIVDVAEIYFKDFLKRCNDYGIGEDLVKNQTPSDANTSQEQRGQLDQLKNMIVTRSSKIQRFREQKELEGKLADLKKNMENENVDDEIKREYFLSMIKLFIYQAIEELNSIEMEKPILEHMAKMKEEGKLPTPKRSPPTSQPLKLVIITKDEVQKAVFGAGYPSVPTMTVKEFYDKRVQDGVFPDPHHLKTGPMSAQEAALAGIDLNSDNDEVEKETNIENDDPETLERLRKMDEFKDDHRRGWGNRMNRS